MYFIKIKFYIYCKSSTIDNIIKINLFTAQSKFKNVKTFDEIQLSFYKNVIELDRGRCKYKYFRNVCNAQSFA